MKNQKGTIQTFLIVVVVLFLIASGIYFYVKSNNEIQSESSITSSSTQPMVNGIYKNNKFGYELTIGNKWHIPLRFNATSDSLAKDAMAGSQPTKEALSQEIKEWDVSDAELVILSDTTLSKENEFYDLANNGKADPSDFPGRQIAIVVSHTKTLAGDAIATSTTTGSLRKILINNKYKGFIRETSGGAVGVSVELTSDGTLSTGNTPNAITFFSDQVSSDEILKIANTLLY